MLKTLMFGAAASLVGAGLFKANREGRLDPLKEKAREGLAHLREAAGTRRAGKESAPGGPSRPGKPPRASAAYRIGPSDTVSRPAAAAPWPADARAL